MIVGPRACGKTTTARRHVATVVRLDREAEAAPVRADPDAVLAALDVPILLDEWQLVPDVLAAVKRAVDDGAAAGSFVATGSVRADLLASSWAATGRLTRITQWGMSQRELHGDVSAPSFFDLAFAGELGSLRPPLISVGLRELVERALRGGYPPTALGVSDVVARRWLGGYVDQLLQRDAQITDEHRDPVKLRRYLVALAANTAGVVEHKTLYDAAGVSRVTGAAYDSLLEALFVSEQVPAWHTNRLNRLTRTAKRYVVDPALLVPMLGLDVRGALRNGDLLGRTLDTFVLGQLRPEQEVAEMPVRLHHLRLDAGRHECDLLAEAADGRVLAMEVKATAAPKREDARHLTWLRDELGATFAGGVVFHTGPRAFALGDRIVALPIGHLWGAR